MIPEYTKMCIDAYVKDHVPPNGFVRAVLENNLREAFGRADENNIANMFSIVQYCYLEIPVDCWGSPANVAEWLSPKVIERYIWRARKDSENCAECMRLDGTTMSILDLQRLRPPLHDGCRCWMEAIK